MEKLSRDWFIEGLMDFEYKKYLVLAYLKSVRDKFNQTRLYPELGDLIYHYRNLTAFRESKEKMTEQFPQAITGIDIEKKKIEYENLVKDDELMREIDLVIEFALPKFKNQLDEGKEIFEFIDEHIEIDPVGILPLHKDDGYMLVQSGNSPHVNAYDYQVTVIGSAEDRYRSIRTSFVTCFEWGIAHTFEDMKLELIRSIPDKPNPATFAIASGMEFPQEESFLPVAKRKFIRYLAAF